MSTRLAKCATASGFVAAILATILGSTLAPEHPTTTLGLITRAVAYITAVFGLAAIAAQLIFLVRKEQNPRTEDIAIHTATAALWLPPFLMFWGQRSWFALVIFFVLALAVARLIAFLKAASSLVANQSRESSSEYQAFSLLKRDFPFGLSILAALMLQGAIFAALDNRVVLATILYLTGTTAVVRRSFQMFRDFPAIGERNSTRSVSAVLIATTFLIVFAWLPYVVQDGLDKAGSSTAGTASSHARWRQYTTAKSKAENKKEGSASTLAWLKSLFSSAPPGPHGDSFAVAKRMFDSTFPEDTKQTDIRPKTGLNTNIPVMMIMGPVFPGVELYPETQPHIHLVAPPPLTKGASISHTDPFSIPFDGVYWFWRGPSDGPPPNSVVMHGSPSAEFFRSTDGDGMSMEAKQNLGFAVDPHSYGAIEIDIQNADPFPNSVSILLKVRNTALPGKPIQSLGMENVVTPGSSEAYSVTQTMRFRLPIKLAMGSFDELTVSYYLRGARSNRSARISIERFRLVPRRG